MPPVHGRPALDRRARRRALCGRAARGDLRRPRHRRRRRGRVRRRRAHPPPGRRPGGTAARGLGHALVAGGGGLGRRRRGTGASSPGPTRPTSCGRACRARETALICLLERRHYGRADTNFNMDVDLRAIPDDPGGHRLAGPEDARRARRVDGGPLVQLAARGPARAPTRGTSSSPARTVTTGAGHRVLRLRGEPARPARPGGRAPGPHGPGRGQGRAARRPARAAPARRATGSSVVWVGPVVPYAAVGGRVSDVFFVYRKELA